MFHNMQNKKTLTQQSFSHQLCSLILTHDIDETQIEMTLLSPHLTTKNLPETAKILKKYAPSVLCTKCHNDAHLPFRKEVKDTEMGHLFEHLLIDHLSQRDANQGIDRTYYGVTEWDWRIDPRGTFHITLSAGEKDQSSLYEAITDSYQLLEKILCSTSAVDETIAPAHINTETVFSVSV